VQFVAVIPEAYVEGEAGLVYDSLGHVFHETDMFPSESTGFVNPMPSRPVEVSFKDSSFRAVFQHYVVADSSRGGKQTTTATLCAHAISRLRHCTKVFQYEVI
jgi:hypothetical protein